MLASPLRNWSKTCNFYILHREWGKLKEESQSKTLSFRRGTVSFWNYWTPWGFSFPLVMKVWVSTSVSQTELIIGLTWGNLLKKKNNEFTVAFLGNSDPVDPGWVLESALLASYDNYVSLENICRWFGVLNTRILSCFNVFFLCYIINQPGADNVWVHLKRRPQ